MANRNSERVASLTATVSNRFIGAFLSSLAVPPIFSKLIALCTPLVALKLIELLAIADRIRIEVAARRIRDVVGDIGSWTGLSCF
jgi:hypothetical protein